MYFIIQVIFGKLQKHAVALATWENKAPTIEGFLQGLGFD